MLTKNLQKNEESNHELPDKINTETPSTRKRKSCGLSAEKQRERTPIPIFLPTEQPLLYPLALTVSVFERMWMKSPI